jgi:hypothetical protein
VEGEVAQDRRALVLRYLFEDHALAVTPTLQIGPAGGPRILNPVRPSVTGGDVAITTRLEDGHGSCPDHAALAPGDTEKMLGSWADSAPEEGTVEAVE